MPWRRLRRAYNKKVGGDDVLAAAGAESLPNKAQPMRQNRQPSRKKQYASTIVKLLSRGSLPWYCLIPSNDKHEAVVKFNFSS